MFLVEVKQEQQHSSVSVTHYLGFLRTRLREEYSAEDGCNTSSSATVTSKFRLVAPFAVPAILYTVTNNLGIVIQMEMDPATYQVHFWAVFNQPTIATNMLQPGGLSMCRSYGIITATLTTWLFSSPTLLTISLRLFKRFTYFEFRLLLILTKRALGYDLIKIISHLFTLQPVVQLCLIFPAQVLGNFKILSTAILFRLIIRRFVVLFFIRCKQLIRFDLSTL